MRKVYLVRHGHPDIPLGERWCLGRTDLPLAAVGRMQAALLPFDPELTGKPVFSSYLMRAIETARPLCAEPRIVPGLEEQDLGEWDGLPFSEIMVRWPELYAAREKNPDVWPESAETPESVRHRMHRAVLSCLQESEGDIVIVSHKSAIDSMTGQRPKLLHTSVSVLEFDGEMLTPAEVGRIPHPELTEEVCLALLHARKKLCGWQTGQKRPECRLTAICFFPQVCCMMSHVPNQITQFSERHGFAPWVTLIRRK